MTTTTPESKAFADVQSMDDGFWPWDTDRAVENSEHPLGWCDLCKSWQPAERLHRVDVTVGWAPSMHGALRKAAGVPIVPTQPLMECSHHLDQYGDHAAARPRVTRYAGGNAWCVYSLTPDELAALRSVDWL